MSVHGRLSRVSVMLLRRVLTCMLNRTPPTQHSIITNTLAHNVFDIPRWNIVDASTRVGMYSSCGPSQARAYASGFSASRIQTQDTRQTMSACPSACPQKMDPDNGPDLRPPDARMEGGPGSPGGQQGTSLRKKYWKHMVREKRDQEEGRRRGSRPLSFGLIMSRLRESEFWKVREYNEDILMENVGVFAVGFSPCGNILLGV
jgi:hypothetical protein